MRETAELRSAAQAEIAHLSARLQEAEDTLGAIRNGEVDALLVTGATGPQIYALQGQDAETNRFRGEMLAQVSDAVIAVDHEERIIYLNTAAERLYGFAASEALGRRISSIRQAHWLRPEDEAAATFALRRASSCASQGRCLAERSAYRITARDPTTSIWRR